MVAKRKPLRAIIEVVDGKVIGIYPIAESDADRAAILAALRNVNVKR